MKVRAGLKIVGAVAMITALVLAEQAQAGAGRRPQRPGPAAPRG